MKQQDDDKLKVLFQELPVSDLSMSFESRLMRQIKIEAEKKTKRIRLYNTLWLGAGIAAITAMISFVCWYAGITVEFPQVETKSLSEIFSTVHFSTPLVALGGLVVVLLMGDTLIRKKIEEKNSKK